MDYARSNTPPTHTWRRGARVWQQQYVGAAAAATAAAAILPSSSQKTDRYRTIFYTTDRVTKSEWVLKNVGCHGN